MLRGHDILYDRDEAGEYLQAYTRSFEDLFFFEIVERRGYQGFGAVNASDPACRAVTACRRVDVFWPITKVGPAPEEQKVTRSYCDVIGAH